MYSLVGGSNSGWLSVEFYIITNIKRHVAVFPEQAPLGMLLYPKLGYYQFFPLGYSIEFI